MHLLNRFAGTIRHRAPSCGQGLKGSLLQRFWFRLIFLCVFLPPVLYIFSIQGLEMSLQDHWHSKLKANLISETEKLLSGGKAIEAEIRGNVQQFLRGNRFIHLGAEATILVRTKKGRLLYPKVTEGSLTGLEPFLGDWDVPVERSRVAARNVRIMREGLQFSLSVHIPRNTWLANGILVFYVFVFAVLLFATYAWREKRAELAVQSRERELEAARDKLETVRKEVREAADKEEHYQREITRLRSELDRTADRLQQTEAQAFQEIEGLEDKLRKSAADRQEKEEEVWALIQEMERLETAEQSSSKGRDKGFNRVVKRFSALYKNLEFSERAIKGFLRLTEEEQLRAEVALQHLDRSSDHAGVKRKVAVGKGGPAVFETEFAAKGRIYWRKGSRTRVWVLAVGTKNTQNRDLEFLSKT